MDVDKYILNNLLLELRKDNLGTVSFKALTHPNEFVVGVGEQINEPLP